MASFNRIVNGKMPKAASIAVLAGCLLLGVLVGMSPMNTTTGSTTTTTRNLRNNSQATSQQQHKSSGGAGMPEHMPGAKLFSLAAQLPTRNEEQQPAAGVEQDESGGIEDKADEEFLWHGDLPTFQEFHLVGSSDEHSSFSFDFGDSFFFSF